MVKILDRVCGGGYGGFFGLSPALELSGPWLRVFPALQPDSSVRINTSFAWCQRCLAFLFLSFLRIYFSSSTA